MVHTCCSCLSPPYKVGTGDGPPLIPFVAASLLLDGSPNVISATPCVKEGNSEDNDKGVFIKLTLLGVERQ